MTKLLMTSSTTRSFRGVKLAQKKHVTFKCTWQWQNAHLLKLFSWKRHEDDNMPILKCSQLRLGYHVLLMQHRNPIIQVNLTPSWLLCRLSTVFFVLFCFLIYYYYYYYFFYFTILYQSVPLRTTQVPEPERLSPEYCFKGWLALKPALSEGPFQNKR